MRWYRFVPVAAVLALLTGCGSTPPKPLAPNVAACRLLAGNVWPGRQGTPVSYTVRVKAPALAQLPLLRDLIAFNADYKAEQGSSLKAYQILTSGKVATDLRYITEDCHAAGVKIYAAGVDHQADTTPERKAT